MKYQCTVCKNIQELNDQCQCCGNIVFEEYFEDIPITNLQMNTQSKHVVIIGGGIASISVIRELLKSTTIQCSITLITKESRLPYYRTAIPKIIHNPLFETQKQFSIEQQSFFDDNHIQLLLQTEVINVNPEKKYIQYQQLNQSNKIIKELLYDELVFATGGESNIPSFISQSKCSNLIPIHSVENIQQIVQCFETLSIQQVCIIGAGLCGIEIAAEIRRKYPTIQIIMIEIANRILPRQLTEQASNMFTNILQQHQIELLTSRCVESIEYLNNNYDNNININNINNLNVIDDNNNNKKIKITMNTGEILCDLVCYSCGIHCNISLANKIGCHCSKGIIVNEFMQTSKSSIYACGDCCEYQSNCYGNWTDAMKQGEICAKTILGIKQSFYHLPMPYFVYCFIGVYSIGKINGYSFWLKQSNDNFIQLFYDEKKIKIIGGILIGKIISKIQRDLVNVIINGIEGDELHQFILQCEQYF